MQNHTCAVMARLPRFLLAFILIATLVVTLTTPQAASSSSDAASSLTTPDTPASSFDPVQLPLSFVENAGQTDADVVFQANGLGKSLFFLQNNVILTLPGSDEPYVVDLDFVGANTRVDVTGTEKLPGIVNYFIGNDPDKWLTNIPTYGGINYQNLYPGVDLNYTGSQSILKSTYTVAVGANASVIAWRYGSTLDTRIDEATGDLHIVLDDIPGSGEVILVERAPVAWQTIAGERVPVDIHYTVDDTNTIRFGVGDYNPAYALTIDPELLYSTYFGGSGTDIAYAVTSDTKGNVYFTGRTNSGNMPRHPAGANALQGDYDAFVTKVNVAISSQQVVYSSYLGGNGEDIGYGIAIDALTNAYVTGQTKSFNFPSYPPKVAGYQATLRPPSDAFVVKFNATGDALLYSTYLGGSGMESGNAIAVDSSGNAYVTGFTTQAGTTPFPTLNARQPSFGGGTQDAFVTKLNAAGTGLVYSTFLGGNGADVGNSIEVYTNPGGAYAYVVGQSKSSSGFPLDNALDNILGGPSEAFLTRFNVNGNTLVFSTFLGGTADEEATDLAIDRNGNAFVTGWTTSSTTFPITSGAKQSIGAGGTDAFITEVNASGSEILYSTYFGGAGNDKAYGIDLDIEGLVHFVGETSSNPDTFPLEGPFEDRNPNPPTWNQVTMEVAPDAFAAGFDPLDTVPGKYLYSSYLGGMNDDPASPSVEDDGVDIAWDVNVDASGGVTIVGQTDSKGFPQVRDTFQRGGGVDAFIAYASSAKADLIIDKIANEFVAPGTSHTYTIEVRNLGPNDAYNVQIHDLLPVPLLSFVSVTPSQGSCTGTVAIICDIGKVRAPRFGDPNPDPVTIVIETMISPTTTGSITNTVKITQSSTFDPNPSLDPNDENANAAEHTAYAVPDLVVTLTSDDYRILSNPAESFQYTIAVRNDSTVPANNVVLTGITLPPDVVYLSHNTSHGTFDLGTGTWTIGTLLNTSGTLTMTIDVRVVLDTPIGTFLPLTATAASAGQDDKDINNNTGTVRVRVVSPYFDSGCHPSPDDPNEVLCLTD